MAIYQLVREENIEHQNEYYELKLLKNGQPDRSLFFTTNEVNLEVCAAAIIADQGIQSKEYRVVPHPKH